MPTLEPVASKYHYKPLSNFFLTEYYDLLKWLGFEFPLRKEKGSGGHYRYMQNFQRQRCGQGIRDRKIAPAPAQDVKPRIAAVWRDYEVPMFVGDGTTARS
jgi:hypothetical protein